MDYPMQWRPISLPGDVSSVCEHLPPPIYLIFILINSPKSSISKETEASTGYVALACVPMPLPPPRPSTNQLNKWGAEQK